MKICQRRKKANGIASKRWKKNLRKGSKTTTMKQGVINYKRIPLKPTKFDLEVWVCDDGDKLIEALADHYGDHKDKFIDMVVGVEGTMVRGSVCHYDHEDDGATVLMLLHSLDDIPTIAHEAIHATWRLADIVGYDYKGCEENQAYLMSYIVEEILQMRDDEPKRNEYANL